MKKAQKDRFASMGPMQQIPKKLGQSMNDNSGDNDLLNQS